MWYTEQLLKENTTFREIVENLKHELKIITQEKDYWKMLYKDQKREIKNKNETIRHYKKVLNRKLTKWN